MKLSYFTAFIAGLLFGVGLIISNMNNPEKILSFLDITGLWDPSLLFVMAGGILVSIIPFYYAKFKQKTLLNQTVSIPTIKTVDNKLIIGSALFGIGWGITGLCPGPALVSIFTQFNQIWFFILPMMVGMNLYNTIEKVLSEK